MGSPPEGRNSPGNKVIVGHKLRPRADSIVTTLAGFGYDARPVYDGQALVALAHEWQPEVALVDLAIPGMAGNEIARDLRGRFGDGIRLIASTTWAVSGFRDESLRAGFDEVVEEASDPGEVLLILRGPTAILVERSGSATRDQARAMLALGHRMLDQRQFARESERRARLIVLSRRALASSTAVIEQAPIPPDGKARLRRDADALARRILRAEQEH